MTRDEECELIRANCNQLMEHFDSVQIFVTRNAPEQSGTVHLGRGEGNYFARLGQVRAWLVKEEEGLREEIRKEDNP